MHMLFDPGDADIKDQKSQRIVAMAVDDDQSTMAIEDAMHFTKSLLLVRVVMKGIAAGHYIERIVGKRQVLSVAESELQPIGEM